RLCLDAKGTADLKRRIAGSPILGRAMTYLEAGAEVIRAAAPVVRKKVGRRLLGVSRTCLKRVVHLAFVYRLTGDRRCLERAEAEMLAAAAFEDWNPSHFLDVGEMTAALAIGYDWLHDDLGADARRTIRAAIVDKGLRTSLAGGWWVDTTNNWNQVCHGGLGLGALAVLEDEPDLAEQILARAVAKLPLAMREYEPDGAYPEGPGYWVYGTTYNVLLIDALRSALGTDFDLAQAKGFLPCADYFLHVTGPTGLFFNYSDCGARHGVSPAMFWFAARRDEPSLLFHERAALAQFLDTARPSAGDGDRLLPFLLIWAPAFDAPAEPRMRCWHADGRTPVAMLRSGWQEAATFFAIKGGSPGSNHAHMDIGAFVMDADGVRWAHDLGAQSYESLESRGIDLWGRGQSSERWTVFRLNNLSHNTLVVDGGPQRVKGSGAITRFSPVGPMPHAIVDLSHAHAGQLQRASRGIGLRPNRSVIVEDEIEALGEPAETAVRWGMVTMATVARLDGAEAVLEQDGRRLMLQVLSPADVTLETYETERPPAAHDAANPGTRMIGFTVRLPAAARRRLTVLLTPGSAEIDRPVVVPLADW
ncbi:MAG: heparinase II/III family protein, partial [Planctomycetes bacterium]|nr:heparinase II/III family protein [Planctomycetota bacterium]